MRGIISIFIILCLFLLFVASCSLRTTKKDANSSKERIPNAGQASTRGASIEKPISTSEFIKQPDSGIFGLKPEQNPLPSPHPHEEIVKFTGEKVWTRDIMNFYLPGRDKIFKPFLVMKSIGLKPGDTIADIGSGVGYFTFRFSRVVGKKGRVYAVDTDDRSLLILNEIIALQERRTGEKFDNIRSVLCSHDSVNLPADSLDIAFICWVGIYNRTWIYTNPAREIKDINEAYKIIYKATYNYTESIKKALKKDGKIVVINDKVNHYGQKDLGENVTLRLMRNHGFELEKKLTIIDGFYFLIFKKKV